MPAAYDSYDYPSYWKGRIYEHKSEILAIKNLLKLIPSIKYLIDIGSGYGRLTPSYIYRVKKAVLADPSGKLLSYARDNLKKYESKIEYIQTSITNLPEKVPKYSFDLALIIRVLHHIENLDQALSIIRKILKKQGYLILEFPNKKHFKASILEFCRGNFTFLMDIFPKDLRSKKSLKSKTLPFINYHPDIILEKLKNHGFDVIEIRSISNIRSSFLKSIFPLETLLRLENYLQKPLSKIYFGPSIIILAKRA